MTREDIALTFSLSNVQEAHALIAGMEVSRSAVGNVCISSMEYKGLTLGMTHIEGELHQTAHVTGVDHG